MSQLHPKRNHGVSLTELLIVMLMSAGALIPIFGLFGSNARQVSFNMDRTVAQVLATQVLERFRYERYAHLKDVFADPAAGATVVKNDPVLNELYTFPTELPEPMLKLYYRFKRAAVFTEAIPGQLGTLTCVVTWSSLSKPDQLLTFQMSTNIRNREFHYGKP